MMIDFTDQIVVVTGAAGGLGRAYAEAIGRRGATVIAHDGGLARDGSTPDPSIAAATAASLHDLGVRAEAETQDLSTKHGCADLIERVLARHGRVDALVHSAGIVRYSGVESTSDEGWLARAVWPGMRERRYGRLVFTVSSYGLRAIEGSDVTAYGVGKAAQFGLMNGLAGEGTAHGIRVNAIEPIAATRIFRRATAVEELTPASVAPAAVVLASRECPWNGRVVNAADGEFQVQHYPASARRPLSGELSAEQLLAELGRPDAPGSDA
jgi:NAD(P)-dependent dehydrogenase (short-subunit alcohol dehydrogenase family)